MPRSPDTISDVCVTESLEQDAPPTDGCHIVVLDGEDKGQSWELSEGSAVIGSSSRCELTLRDSAISGRHARVEVTAEGLRVEDLGSTNGLLYLGSRIEHAQVPHGAVLTLGRTRVALTSRRPQIPGISERIAYGELIGAAPAMRGLYSVLERIESVDYTVLLHGETGVGKELVAHEIHRHSARSEGPFEILDCAALPQELAESQLFGHARGAFTGAVDSHDGVFVRAHRGTLFIDEIGELPLQLQPKLLRVLESRSVQPIGASSRTQVDVRVLAATNRDLGEEVKAGRFREDLFFRLNVISIRVPPLRARREDIPALVRRLLELNVGDDVVISDDTVELMTCGYDWPGNVRELRNAIVRVASLGSLPEPLQVEGEGSGVTPAEMDLDQPLLQAKRRLVEAFERDYLQSQLARSDGNIGQAARRSGVDRSYFKRMLKRHGLLSPR